jgi:hypothetical protein
MIPDDYYKQQLKALETALRLLITKKSQLAWLRFAAIIGIPASWYVLYNSGWNYVTVACLLLLIIFTRLVFADLKNKAAIEHTNFLIAINKDELKALAHQYHHFPNGTEHIPKEHDYCNDLDIFGHASLYQYINRTNSQMGSNILAGWLSNPSTPESIIDRQLAVKELATQTPWRQQLQAIGAAKKIQTATQIRLQNWFAEKNRFLHNPLWQYLRYIIPALLFTVILLNITELLSNYVRNYCLLTATLLAFYISKKVTPIHQQVSKMSDELDVLSESIQLIEKSTFNSAGLQSLQLRFKHGKQSASSSLYQLKKILERLDMRFNIVVFIPLDILFLWDLQQVLALEKWKQQNHKDVMEWFTTLGEFEAASSLATLSFNHPHWCFPILKEQHFFIEGKELGHPLIPAGKCVTNPVNIEQSGELMLVTGSNMAGKSTYLRSIGVNTVLAMAGSPVCAGYFCLSPVQIISSMRIADNLEESTSTFYAELKKLKTVIDKVNNKEKVFILLDEILRGTNSLDRHTGSAALIKQLIKHHAVGILATHDVELAKMKDDYPANILNYHFDVQVNNDELYFDYKLKEGICTSLNASILMKKIGIEL